MAEPLQWECKCAIPGGSVHEYTSSPSITSSLLLYGKEHGDKFTIVKTTINILFIVTKGLGTYLRNTLSKYWHCQKKGGGAAEHICR